MKESFEDMLRRVLPSKEFNEDLEEYFGSPHMRTKILRKPEKATHAQLLHFSKITGMEAYELLEKWGVGREKVSELERDNLKKLAAMAVAA